MTKIVAALCVATVANSFAAACKAQLLADLNQTRIENLSRPGLGAAGDTIFVQHGAHLYFPARTRQGTELLRMPTQGPAVTPSVVTQLGKLDANRKVHSIASLDASNLLFVAQRGRDGIALFSTRGTLGSERLVAELGSGFGNAPILSARMSNPARMLLAIFTKTWVPGSLWVTDGSSAGTTQLATIDVFEMHIDAAGRRAFLFAQRGNDRGLFVSDGTKNGLRLVQRMQLGEQLEAFANVGNEVMFIAKDRSSGREVWASDGTAMGTRRVTELGPGITDGVEPYGLSYGGRYWFIGRAASGDKQIYSSDGSTSGTRVESKLPKGWGVYIDSPLVLRQRRLWISAASSQAYGSWVFDPATGSHEVLNISVPSAFFDAANGEVDIVSQANVGELWRSDGTRAGTRKIADLQTQVIAPRRPGSYVLDRGELWALDAGRTQIALVADLYPGSSTESSSIQANASFEFGTDTYFPLQTRDASTSGLWSTAGNAASTRFRYAFRAMTKALRVGKRMLFGATDSRTRTPGLIALEANAARSLGSFRGRVAKVVGRAQDRALVLRPGSVAQRFELWLSDGTDTGSALLITVSSDAVSTSAIPGSRDFLIAAGNTLLRSDGSSAGTKPYATLPGVASGPLQHCANGFVFTCEDPTTGAELWLTDGRSSRGTRLIADLEPGPGSSLPQGMITVGDRVYFSAYDAAHGRELWRTDGSSAGTTRVVDLYPGPSSSYPEGMIQSGPQHVSFVANHPKFGREVFESDGGGVGTALLRDIHPFGDSSPRILARRGDALLVAADDGVHGIEPHLVSLGASSWTTTRGCFGLRHNRLEATKPRLGTTQRVLSGMFTSGAARALFLGTPRGTNSAAIAACESAWDILGPLVALDVWSSTSADRQTSIGVPRDPALLGVRYALQTLTVSSALTNGLALSNGVECVVGR